MAMKTVFDRVGESNITDTGRTITVPSGETWTIIGLIVANSGDTDLLATLRFTIGAVPVYVMNKTRSVTGGWHNVVGGDVKVVLKSGDQVFIETDGATKRVDMLLSYMSQSEI